MPRPAVCKTNAEKNNALGRETQVMRLDLGNRDTSSKLQQLGEKIMNKAKQAQRYISCGESYTAGCRAAQHEPSTAQGRPCAASLLRLPVPSLATRPCVPCLAPTPRQTALIETRANSPETPVPTSIATDAVLYILAVFATAVLARNFGRASPCRHMDAACGTTKGGRSVAILSVTSQGAARGDEAAEFGRARPQPRWRASLPRSRPRMNSIIAAGRCTRKWTSIHRLPLDHTPSTRKRCSDGGRAA